MEPSKKDKDRLKPISFYDHNPEDMIRAFIQVDPQKLRKREEQELKGGRLNQNRCHLGGKHESSPST